MLACQTAAIGGYRGRSFARKSVVPSSEEESDGGFSSGNEGEAESLAKHLQSNESKKEKLGRQQREKRRLKARRARKRDLRVASSAAAAEDAEDGRENCMDTEGAAQSDDAHQVPRPSSPSTTLPSSWPRSSASARGIAGCIVQ